MALVLSTALCNVPFHGDPENILVQTLDKVPGETGLIEFLQTLGVGDKGAGFSGAKDDLPDAGTRVLFAVWSSPSGNDSIDARDVAAETQAARFKGSVEGGVEGCGEDGRPIV